MYGQDYKSKYLKYKQKYTNALQNMQGGGDAELRAALQTQPQVVYVVDKLNYDKLKLSFDLGENQDVSIEQLPSQFNEEVIRKAIAMLNPKAIRILPMKSFKKESSATKLSIIKIGKNKIEFKDGIENVDGTSAEVIKESPFGGLSNFGQDVRNRYNSQEALQHLKNAYTYFNTTCKLTTPCVLVLLGNKLHLCSALTQATIGQ